MKLSSSQFFLPRSSHKMHIEMNFDFHVRWYARMTEWVSERDAWCEWDKIKTFFSRNAHFHAEKACLCSTSKNSIIKFIQCKNMLLFMIKSPSSVCDCNVCVWICCLLFHAISIMSLNLQISSIVFVRILLFFVCAWTTNAKLQWINYYAIVFCDKLLWRDD